MGLLGQIVWCEQFAPLELVEVEGLRMLRGGLPSGGLFWSGKLKRLCRGMRRQGVRRILVPSDFDGWNLVKKFGLSPVENLTFLRSCGGELLVLALKKRGYEPTDCAVALRGTRVGRDMILAADVLSPQVREMIISAPQGGESLQNLLRREWGMAVYPDRSDVEGVIRFDGGGEGTGEVVLSLFGGAPELGGLAVDRTKFPQFYETEPLKLLAILWESGKIDRENLEFYLT